MGSGPASEQEGCCERTIVGQRRAADAIDAGKNEGEALSSHGVVDLMLAATEIEELSPRYESVLPGRKRGNSCGGGIHAAQSTQGVRQRTRIARSEDV